MRVLYIATWFPEPASGATIYTDLAEALHEAGHKITVAVPESVGNKKRTTIKKERGFEVLRVVTGNYADLSFVQKGFTTLKIPMLMKRGIYKHLKNRKFDFILFEAPPVTNGDLVLWAKKQFQCPAYLMLKGIFPQNAVDLGILNKDGLFYHFFKLREKKLLRTADYIGCMSEANKHYLIENYSWIESKRIEIFPNTKKISTDFGWDDSYAREQFNIPKDACVFLFGGNMGKPQYVEFLCKVMEKCIDEQDIYFLFIGSGTDRIKVEQTIANKGINNASVIKNLPRDQYEKIARECDVGLIILDPRFTIPNYSSKILFYMEHAKPILAATDKVTDLRRLIEEADCGEWVWSGDINAFVEKAKEMSTSTQLDRMGKNGREYLEKYLTVDRSVTQLESHFKK